MAWAMAAPGPERAGGIHTHGNIFLDFRTHVCDIINMMIRKKRNNGEY